MAGANAGVLEGSEAFWAKAGCDATAVKHVIANSRRKTFEESFEYAHMATDPTFR